MRLIFAICATVVFLSSAGYSLVGHSVVGSLERSAKEAAARPDITESDLSDTGNITKAERVAIAKSCRAAFAVDRALDEVIADIARQRSKAEPFCACVAEDSAEMTVYDRAVMVALLQNHGINLNKLRRGLEAIIVSSASASSRHYDANKRIQRAYESCKANNELE